MAGRFNKLHPLVSFSYYVGALSLLFLFFHPNFLLTGLSIIVLVNYFQDRCRGLQRWLFLMMSSGLLILVINPIFNERGRTVLLEAGGHRVTLEAVIYGSMSALSIMGIIALFVSYNEIMTPNKLLFLFSKVMPQFSILLMLTLRFIPLMRRRLDDISVIQTSKGLSVTGGNWRNRIGNGMLYIQTLLVHSLEEAIQTADSMKARAYGQGQRSSYHHYRFKSVDCLFLLILLCLFLIAVYGRVNGMGQLQVYPELEGFLFSEGDGLLFTVFLIYLSMPILTDAGDEIRWRLLN